MPLIPSICPSKNTYNNTNAITNPANAAVYKITNEMTVQQKLSSMEAAVARASTLKRELHASADQARSGIRQAIDLKLTALRDREQELLREVDSILSRKDDFLDEQRALLNQTIGAWKQIRDGLCVEQNMINDEISKEFLQRLVNSIEQTSPSALYDFSTSIIFENASSDEELDRQISVFGQIKDGNVKNSDSGNLFGTWLAQKHLISSSSVASSITVAADDQAQFDFLRDRVTSTSLSTSSFDVISATNGIENHSFPNPQPQNSFGAHFAELNRLTTDYWLKSSGNGPKNVAPPVMAKSIPPLYEMENSIMLEANVKNQKQRKRSNAPPIEEEISKSFANREDTNCSRSWLVSSDGPTLSCNAVFTSILASPKNKWLFSNEDPSFDIQTFQPPNAKVLRTSIQSQNNYRQRSNTLNSTNSSLFETEEEKGEEVSSEDGYIKSEKLDPNQEVEEAVKRLVELFESKQFLQTKCDQSLEEMKFSPKLSLSRCDAVYPLLLPDDPAYWLKKYPPPKQNRPMNEMAEDLSCWESVLGWKGILERIHGSGEDVWLAPSSRAIKSDGSIY